MKLQSWTQTQFMDSLVGNYTAAIKDKYDLFTDRYITSLETGSQPVTDIFHFVVYDGDNNRLDNQMCTITITSTLRQPPVVTVHSGIKVHPPYFLTLGLH